MFDFSIVLKQISTVYPSHAMFTEFSEKDVVDFFKMYYSYYERYTGHTHPFLKNETIGWVIESLSSDGLFDYHLEDYEEIIPEYFNTHFDSCDYSLVHFMSGKIRQMRRFEILDLEREDIEWQGDYLSLA